jgi:hypothetical protein
MPASVGLRLLAFNSGACPRQLLTISLPPNRSNHGGEPKRLNGHGSARLHIIEGQIDPSVSSRDEPKGDNVVSFHKGSA